MMQPMPRLVDADDGSVLKRRRAAVLGRVAGLAFLAVQEKGRAVDSRPQASNVVTRHIVRRPGAHVVVELPAVGAVLVLVDALGGQVPRLVGREMRVLALHAAKGVFDRRV